MLTGEKKEERGSRPDITTGGKVYPFATLKKRNDFNKLKKEGKVFKNRYMLMYIMPQKTGKQLRAGFSITKKSGKAFQRNKIRRILKEILRKVNIPFAIDVLIIIRNTIYKAGFEEVKTQVEKSLRQFFLSYR